MWRSENYPINTYTYWETGAGQRNWCNNCSADFISGKIYYQFLPIRLRDYFCNFMHLKKSEECCENNYA